ncbi:cupin domain-containing protein [Sphingomonas tabacisoli]|uniref:Cupin domain-containing protein n=1 Tax=Sphingomonas tabacisoli TaxID=2249466 RepID=A0ABW4I2C1_9SPHN
MLMIAVALAAQVALPTRVPLSTIPISPAKTVTRVEATRVDFAPGQAMPEHLHTVPVVCFAAKGAFLTRIGDGPEQRLKEGQASIEPAQTVVHYFRNASATAPAQLLCAILADTADKQLNIMLPQPR